jgi:putative resolvase
LSKSSQAGLVTLRKAAEILDCGMSTLRTWDREGKLTAVRTPGGQRRYRIEDLEHFQGIDHKLALKSESVAIYCRVSSHEQKAKGDLDRQKARLLEHCVKKQYTVTQILDEVGSGMNDARPKMLKLFALAVKGEIGRVVIDHGEPHVKLLSSRLRQAECGQQTQKEGSWCQRID